MHSRTPLAFKLLEPYASHLHCDVFHTPELLPIRKPPMTRLLILSLLLASSTTALAQTPKAERNQNYAQFTAQYNRSLDDFEAAIHRAKANPDDRNTLQVCAQGRLVVEVMQKNRAFKNEFEQESGRSFDAALNHWQQLAERNAADCASIQKRVQAQ